MSLTLKDIKKIEKLFEYKLKSSVLRKDFAKFREEMRADFSLLKDLTIEMHFVMTTELPLLSTRVERHEAEIITLKNK